MQLELGLQVQLDRFSRAPCWEGDTAGDRYTSAAARTAGEMTGAKGRRAVIYEAIV